MSTPKPEQPTTEAQRRVLRLLVAHADLMCEIDRDRYLNGSLGWEFKLAHLTAASKLSIGEVHAALTQLDADSWIQRDIIGNGWRILVLLRCRPEQITYREAS